MTACRKFILPALLLILAACLFAFIFQVSKVYRRFSAQTSLDYSEIAQIWQQAQAQTVKKDDNHINFLLLGTDTLEYRVQNYPITDTMILGSLNLDSGSVSLVPVPRDIYLADFGYKINMIYPVAYQASAAAALQKTTATLSTLFDLPIHYSLVVSLDDVREFIQLLGGVDVTIDRSFTDEKFPRTDVDITTVTDPALLYETISFASGEAHLDAQTALKFIRSRHGDNGEGNDYARSARQEKVIAAVVDQVFARLSSQLKQLDFTFLGQLYDFYQSHYSQQISFVELLAIGRDYLLANQPLTVSSQSLNISPGSATANLQETQASWRNGNQWSLTVTSWPALRQELHSKLNLLANKN